MKIIYFDMYATQAQSTHITLFSGKLKRFNYFLRAEKKQ